MICSSVPNKIWHVFQSDLYLLGLQYQYSILQTFYFTEYLLYGYYYCFGHADQHLQLEFTLKKLHFLVMMTTLDDNNNYYLSTFQ